MREILFRGKQDGGDWVYGLPYEIKEKYSSICKIAPYPIGGGWFVLSATLGQFTGLTDKNGAKIFDGDIVVNSFGRKFLVDFQSLINGVKLPAEEYREIIGNIHDNPELLEEGGGDGDSRT